MAKHLKSSYLLSIVIQYLVFGFQVYAGLYDDSFTHECLEKPPNPLYGGGIVRNPEFDEGLKGWTRFGVAKIEHRVSVDGNKYIVASKRKQPFHSFTQTFYLERKKLYTISAWLQTSHGSANIAAILKTNTSYYEIVAWVTAQNGCWSMLKGGFHSRTSGLAQFYFETNNTETQIWGDSISLQRFTHNEWKSHQRQSIEKVRKARVRIQAVDNGGRPIPNAAVSLTQISYSFPFGCAINHHILDNPAYQNWFLYRFKHTVFENELKWYTTEPSQGHTNYYSADNLLRFAQSNGIAVRGHNVFWEDPNYQLKWVLGLSSNTLLTASKKRINSVMHRYKGKLHQWDAVNENLHFNFFEKALRSPNASAVFYRMAHAIDPKTTPFLNDYNTLECSSDPLSTPSMYVQKIQKMRGQGYNGPLGIGLEAHFPHEEPNLPYIKSALDALGDYAKKNGLTIWVTELDVQEGPNQAKYLKQILNELHSHWAVDGIMLWAAISPQGCYRMCLTDDNFKNLATGDVVDNFIDNQLKHAAEFDSPATTDSNGFYEISLNHGEYQVQVAHPDGNQISNLRQINVVSKAGSPDVYHFRLNA